MWRYLASGADEVLEGVEGAELDGCLRDDLGHGGGVAGVEAPEAAVAPHVLQGAEEADAGGVGHHDGREALEGGHGRLAHGAREASCQELAGGRLVGGQLGCAELRLDGGRRGLAQPGERHRSVSDQGLNAWDRPWRA